MKLVKKIALATALSLASFLPTSQTTAIAKENKNQNAKPANTKATNTNEQQKVLLTLEEYIQNAEEAKVEIRNGDEQRAVFGSGSVYMKKDGYYYILTNNHVIEGGSLETMKIVEGRNDTYKEDDIPLEIVVASFKKDAAIVRAKESDVLKYNQLRDEYNATEKNKKKKIDVFKGELGNSDEVKVLDEIIVAGYPITLSGITRGWVSSTTYYELSPQFGTDHECFIISNPISPGNSGSAAYLVKDNKLYLIGLVHAGFTGAKTQNMNLAIKLNEFKQMMFEFKNPDNPSEEEIKRIAEKSEKGGQLDNLFAISSGQVYMTMAPDGSISMYTPKYNILLTPSQDGGFKFVLYKDNFPDNLVERTELIDKKENSFGALDTVILKDRETAEMKDVATMPDYLKDVFRGAYNALAKNIANYIEYKKLLNKEGKLSFAETERLKQYEVRIQMLNNETLTKLNAMDAKWNEYLAQEKQKKAEAENKAKQEKEKEKK